MSLGLTYLRIVLSRWRLVLGSIVLCTVAAWAFSALYLAQKPKFEAAARLNIVPTPEELNYATRFVRGSTFDGGSVLLGTYSEFAHTRPVVEPIVDRYVAEQAAASGMSVDRWIAANSNPPGFSPGRILSILNYGQAPSVPLREDLIQAVIEGTTIENVEGTYLVRLSVEWEDPKSAAWFANALSGAIIAHAEEASRKTGQQLATTLEARLDQKRAELAGVLKQSRDLKSGIGVVDIDRQKQSLLEARLLEQAQLTTDRATLDSARIQVAALRSQANGKLSSAQQTLEQTIAVEGPRAAGLARSVAVRTARIGQIEKQIASLGGSEDRVKALDDRATALQAEVAALTERVSFSRTENLVNGPRIQLIERATPPLVRSSPKIFFNTVFGFIAGCALAACLLLLLGPRKPRIEFEEAEVLPATAIPASPPIEALPPEPAPVRQLPADHPSPFRLPRPANGVSYTPDEIVGLTGPLNHWLAEPLAPDSRPVFVGGVGGDLDAKYLSQLLHGLLRRAGAALQIIDATQSEVHWDGPGKPFVYLGGLAGSARPELLAHLPADGHLVLAGGDAAQPDWRSRAEDAPAQGAYVVAFDR
ncbi:hypothetical protein [Sphingomonas xinjiangensis]|uniref:Uncharacterized protein involved in exopolysaccharide biosynthesis n=1 Tax=Sphingomonas xinjiangensis TaxID=643568 RepID=A0A840YME8_9SPHN|nr:hypothetical protein [Sphingomonas xinjiangensis]MBB5710986.1 uncharacterized protein involved in exopolysaccharide biosynthesis [Sphingomonas xinjiangensis]